MVANIWVSFTSFTGSIFIRRYGCILLLSILVKIGLIFKIHNTNQSGNIPTSPKMVHTDNTLTIHPYCTHRQSTLTVHTDSKHWLYTMTIHTECIYWWHTLTVHTDGTHLYTDSTNWLYSQTINSMIGSEYTLLSYLISYVVQI